MHKIVIVGGGFAGVRIARKLRNQKNISITLVNDSENFRYYPAFYRAATGFKLSSALIPLNWMLLDNNVTSLVVNKALSIDADKKIVHLQGRFELEYDFAVLALGSETTYFNIEGMHEHSYGIKSDEEIKIFKDHLHTKIESKDSQKENYIIVGAGPTGVELAGMLGVYLKKISKLHKVHNHNIHIWLVDVAPRVLPQLNEKASKIAHKQLRKKGVKIQLNTVVNKETVNLLKTSEGNIKTHTVIWTAGTSINRFYKRNKKDFVFSERGKIVVDKHLQTNKNIYIAGDNAATQYSGTALTAVRHGKFVAKDIMAQINKVSRPKKYEEHPAVVIPIGSNWAIMQYRSIVLSGRAISWVRKFADYVGYSDVLGYTKALTIWSASENTEEACQTCR